MAWTHRLVTRGQEQFGDRYAIADEDRAVTYSELARRVRGVAAGLRNAMVRQGDRVAVQSRNRVEVVETYLALGELGAVAVPVHWTATAAEVGAIVERCDIGLRVGEREVIARSPITGGRAVPFDSNDYLSWIIDVPANPDPDADDTVQDTDLLFILHTSATTGEPKGVMVHHGSVASAMSGWLDTAQHTGTIVLMHCTPLSHGSLVVPLGYLSIGATIALTRVFTPPSCIAAVRRWQASHIFAVPQMIKLVVDTEGLTAADLSSVREIVYAASPMSREILIAARKALGCDFRQMYGLTEAGGPAAMLKPEDHDYSDTDAPNTAVGRPITGVSLQIRDEHGRALPVGSSGEVCMRGPGAMRGYWRHRGATAEALTADGWVRSGDLGYIDDNGMVHLTGRLKDVINFAGHKVLPGEVEDVLRLHPGVADVCVVGVVSDVWGEVPHAFIVVERDSAGAGSEGQAVAALQRLCHDRLSPYKRPAKYTIVDEIPRNPAGKVLRRVLRERAVGDV